LDEASQTEDANESLRVQPHNLFDTSVCVSPSKEAVGGGGGLEGEGGVGEEPIRIVLSLSMNLSDVQDRARFQKEVHADVVWAAAVDPAKVLLANASHPHAARSLFALLHAWSY